MTTIGGSGGGGRFVDFTHLLLLSITVVVSTCLHCQSTWPSFSIEEGKVALTNPLRRFTAAGRADVCIVSAPLHSLSLSLSL